MDTAPAVDSADAAGEDDSRQDEQQPEIDSMQDEDEDDDDREQEEADEDNIGADGMALDGGWEA
jgi:hypothetical protein